MSSPICNIAAKIAAIMGCERAKRPETPCGWCRGSASAPLLGGSAARGVSQTAGVSISGLNLSTYKVLADGQVECENDLDSDGSVVEDETPMAKDLPIPQRRYKGVFRTPPRTSIEPGNTEDVAQ